MFEALKKIMAASEELGTVEDISVLNFPVSCPKGGRHTGKMVVISGKIEDDLKFYLEFHVNETAVMAEEDEE